MAEEYSEVERKTDELALAKSYEALEAARDAMHADRSEANIAAYKEESQKVATIRVAFREKYPPPVPEGGDGVAVVDAVATTGGVHSG